MPDLHWLGIGKGTLRLRDIAMLEWIHYVKPNPPQWPCPEDLLFILKT